MSVQKTLRTKPLGTILKPLGTKKQWFFIHKKPVDKKPDTQKKGPIQRVKNQSEIHWAEANRLLIKTVIS